MSNALPAMTTKTRRNITEQLAFSLNRVEGVLSEGRYSDPEDIAYFTAHRDRLRVRLEALVA